MKVYLIPMWAAAILLFGCGGAFQTGTPWSAELVGPIADVWISSEGRVLPIYHLDGQNYLLGDEGDRYAICLKNHIDQRLEAVVSVDGRDVVSGRIADYKQDRGYVLLPGEEICIEGFRQSLNEVATFEFTRPDDSYAARMGDGTNVGVIGVALFEELAAPPPPPPSSIAAEKPAFDRDVAVTGAAQNRSGAVRAGGQMAQESGLGTGYGRSVSSDAEVVPFTRASAKHPESLVVLYYDDREGLESIGVVFSGAPGDPSKPDPFPGVKTEDPRFAPPPPPP